MCNGDAVLWLAVRNVIAAGNYLMVKRDAVRAQCSTFALVGW